VDHEIGFPNDFPRASHPVCLLAPFGYEVHIMP
jgi:hypothetical protein